MARAFPPRLFAVVDASAVVVASSRCLLALPLHGRVSLSARAKLLRQILRVLDIATDEWIAAWRCGRRCRFLRFLRSWSLPRRALVAFSVVFDFRHPSARATRATEIDADRWTKGSRRRAHRLRWSDCCCCRCCSVALFRLAHCRWPLVPPGRLDHRRPRLSSLADWRWTRRSLWSRLVRAWIQPLVVSRRRCRCRWLSRMPVGMHRRCHSTHTRMRVHGSNSGGNGGRFLRRRWRHTGSVGRCRQRAHPRRRRGGSDRPRDSSGREKRGRRRGCC